MEMNKWKTQKNGLCTHTHTSSNEPSNIHFFRFSQCLCCCSRVICVLSLSLFFSLYPSLISFILFVTVEYVLEKRKMALIIIIDGVHIEMIAPRREYLWDECDCQWWKNTQKERTTIPQIYIYIEATLIVMWNYNAFLICTKYVNVRVVSSLVRSHSKCASFRLAMFVRRMCVSLDNVVDIKTANLPHTQNCEQNGMTQSRWTAACWCDRTHFLVTPTIIIWANWHFIQ